MNVLGITEDDQAQAEKASPIIMGTAFPRLENLEFIFTEKWEEWDDSEITGGETIMPCLRYLLISYSDKLKALPAYILGLTTLERLVIIASHHLENRFNGETGQDWPNISHVPNISFRS